MVLFFGCRRESEDFIYREELEGHVGSGLLTSLHTAFSRDQPHKVYVQHLMQQRGAELWSLLDRQSYFYVCGYVCFRNIICDCSYVYIGLSPVKSIDLYASFESEVCLPVVCCYFGQMCTTTPMYPTPPLPSPPSLPPSLPCAETQGTWRVTSTAPCYRCCKSMEAWTQRRPQTTSSRCRREVATCRMCGASPASHAVCLS